VSRRAGKYTEEEVRTLIEEYAGIKAKVDTTRPALRYLVMMADLDRALKQLPRKYREVVLLHGLIGLSSVETAELLQVSYRSVGKRYHQALEEIHYLLNGGA
jgi:DNA-directed RNA polymerase specialized sigma24 family protein